MLNPQIAFISKQTALDRVRKYPYEVPNFSRKDARFEAYADTLTLFDALLMIEQFRYDSGWPMRTETTINATMSNVSATALVRNGGSELLRCKRNVTTQYRTATMD